MFGRYQKQKNTTIKYDYLWILREIIFTKIYSYRVKVGISINCFVSPASKHDFFDSEIVYSTMAIEILSAQSSLRIVFEFLL
jgi:hypothetical protein